MFWDIPSPWPVWLSGAFSELKITANSGRWEAKLGEDGLEQGENEKNTCFGGGLESFSERNIESDQISSTTKFSFTFPRKSLIAYFFVYMIKSSFARVAAT